MFLKNITRCVYIVILTITLCQTSLFSQQLPIFNQQQANSNPAYIPSDYFKFSLASSASIRYRHQWTDIKGAPTTITGSYLSYNEDVQLLYGGGLIHDQTGPTGFTGLYGRAGYAFSLSRDLLLTFGLKAGLIQYRIKGTELNFLEEEDLANNDFTKYYPDISLGAMLYFKEHYYIGFSVPHIFELDLTLKADNGDYTLKRVRHYNSIIGGRIDLGGGSWIEGSSEFRYVANVPLYFNGKVQFDFRNLFWVAANVSKTKEYGAEFGLWRSVGMNSNILRIGYSFSNHFQTYGPQFGVVHELMGSFSF